MPSTTAANIDHVHQWFDHLSALRFADAWNLDDRDGFIWVPKLREKLPLPQWEDSYERLMAQQFPDGGVQYENGIVTAEANRVNIQNESRGAIRSGGSYHNHYSWLFEFNDAGLISGIYEYMDTLHSERTIHAAGWSGPRGDG